jgi:hypothetical protein
VLHFDATAGGGPMRVSSFWMREHGGGAGMSVRNKTAQELGVSRDEIEVSLTNLVKTELAAQSGPEGGTIALTPFGREFLRAVLD